MMGREGWGVPAKPVVVVTLCLQAGNRELNAGIQLVVLIFPFYSFADPWSMGQCHPHSGWVFPPQLSLAGHTFTNICE